MIISEKIHSKENAVGSQRTSVRPANSKLLADSPPRPFSLSPLLPLPLPRVSLHSPASVSSSALQQDTFPHKGLSPAGRTSLPASEAHQLHSTNAGISGFRPVSFLFFFFLPCILSKSLILFSYSLIALSQSPSVTEASKAHRWREPLHIPVEET